MRDRKRFRVRYETSVRYTNVWMTAYTSETTRKQAEAWLAFLRDTKSHGFIVLYRGAVLQEFFENEWVDEPAVEQVGWGLPSRFVPGARKNLLRASKAAKEIVNDWYGDDDEK